MQNNAKNKRVELLMKLKCVLCLLLAIILGVSGCMGIGFASEREILRYLETKYGEKFVVIQRGWANNEIIAYAHPAGNESELFTVRVDGTGRDKRFGDGYGFIFAEEQILPEYKAFIFNALPDAKITLRIGNSLNVTHGTHSRGVSFEEFLAKEPYVGINIKLFVSDGFLDDKETFFEELSHTLYETPNREIHHGYEIVFVKAEQFSGFDASLHRWTSGLEYGREIDEVVAYTVTPVRPEHSQDDINEFLIFWFIDVSNLPAEPRIDRVGDEDN
jgi:hypothetical protein